MISNRVCFEIRGALAGIGSATGAGGASVCLVRDGWDDAEDGGFCAGSRFAA
jgi:hypothetical protein